MDKIFGWIGDLFTKIWRLFKKILPYIMIALAVYFTFGGSFVLLGMELKGYAAVVAAMGLSFLVAPEETVDTVSGVAGSIGTAAGAIVAAGVGGVASGLFGGENSWLVFAAVAVGAYLLLSGGRKSDEPGALVLGRQNADADEGDEPIVAGPLSPLTSGPLREAEV